MWADRQRRDEFERHALVFLQEIYRYAARVSGDRRRAEDLTQETFLQAWRSFDRFAIGTNCRAWLYRIFHNVLSHARREMARERLASDLDDLPPSVATYDPPLPQTLDVRLVHEAFAALSEDTRELLLLADVEGFTYREMADVLDIPIGTVMSRVSRARKRLRALVTARINRQSRATRASGE